jgi:hypothetical protein
LSPGAELQKPLFYPVGIHDSMVQHRLWFGLFGCSEVGLLLFRRNWLYDFQQFHCVGFSWVMSS